MTVFEEKAPQEKKTHGRQASRQIGRFYMLAGVLPIQPLFCAFCRWCESIFAIFYPVEVPRCGRQRVKGGEVMRRRGQGVNEWKAGSQLSRCVALKRTKDNIAASYTKRS